LNDVFPYLDPPDGLTIFYEVKADLSEDDVRVLAQAGVRKIQPGIEALATSTLKLMRKGTSVFTNLRLLINCRRYEVSPMWNLLLGFPGEEEPVFAKYLRDIPLLYHLMPPTGAFPVRFDRFSPYFVDRQSFGLDLHPLDMYSYIYPFEPTMLERLAYYFTDREFGAPYQIAMRKMLRPVQDAVAHWRRRFEGSDGSVAAELFVTSREEQRVVCDSRTGERVEHELDDRCADLLARLRHVANARDVDERAELQWLQRRGLLFEEEGRVMSIVSPDAPARAMLAGRAVTDAKRVGVS